MSGVNNDTNNTALANNNNSNLATSKLKAPSKIAKPTSLAKPSSHIQPTVSNSATTLSGADSNTITASVASKTITQSDDASENICDFKLGDKVWMNGNKPGVLAFIGETSFKEGIWAGVILDTPEGKNNGTINGVTYFQTEENRGVFCRPNKLTRTQIIESQQETQNPESTANNSCFINSADSSNTSNLAVNNLKLGDKVVINSAGGATKLGILRYIGATEFAVGDWAGVELFEKIGKNDGSVGDKR
jgi:CAP-Gly domain-containing linker protein 1